MEKGASFSSAAARSSSADDLHEVSPQEARELFPPLKQVLKALYFKGGARVDGRRLAGALLSRRRSITACTRRMSVCWKN
ncbi:MAG: FAD-dependent oxidoreductase [Anaerolineae bacterium]